MKVRFAQFGEVKVDDNIHSLYIDSSCEKVWKRRGFTITYILCSTNLK